MDLLTIRDIKLDDVSSEVLQDVREAALKVNELRPLKPEVIEQVQRELVGERVYSSNAIEGNTYDLRETIAILKAGHVARHFDRKREATEVINLARAIDYIQTTEQPDRHRVEKFLEVHGILLRDIDDARAGRFRDQRVMITGATHQPPHHDEVPDLVNRFLTELRDAKEADTVVLATWAHWAVARIHPFFDGNGRMARLWQDLTLFHGRLACAIIRPQDRRDYLASLEAADEGDFNPLIQLVGQRTAATLDKYLSAQQKVEEISGWAAELVGESTARVAEKRKLTYLRWAREMEALRYEFERCAARITQLSTDIDIELQPYDVIDQPTWENLRSSAGAAKTWFFRMFFRRQAKHIRYFFFFGHHFWSEADTSLGSAKPGVSLLVSEALESYTAKRLETPTDNPLTIRELLVVDSELIRKRFDAAKEADAYDRGISATMVAKQFIEEVILLRLT